MLDGYWREAGKRIFRSGNVRKGLQTLDFAFDAESLTHFGGVFLIQRFLQQTPVASSARADSPTRAGVE
jgi:hypothetical protein